MLDDMPLFSLLIFCCHVLMPRHAMLIHFIFATLMPAADAAVVDAMRADTPPFFYALIRRFFHAVADYAAFRLRHDVY